jgi:hypothetical protein
VHTQHEINSGLGKIYNREVQLYRYLQTSTS